MSQIPKPRNWGTFQVEPFDKYREKWPEKYGNIPNLVIETWIYRHWSAFQEWLPLQPLSWKYELKHLPSVEIAKVRHVGDWMDTIKYWGDDLFNGKYRKDTWLGNYCLKNGTSPAPIIIAENAGKFRHPRESGQPFMCEPYQIIEGHMRLAYLQAMIRKGFENTKSSHEVFIATLY